MRSRLRGVELKNMHHLEYVPVTSRLVASDVAAGGTHRDRHQDLSRANGALMSLGADLEAGIIASAFGLNINTAAVRWSIDAGRSFNRHIALHVSKKSKPQGQFSDSVKRAPQRSHARLREILAPSSKGS